jgi:hypothetical protein
LRASVLVGPGPSGRRKWSWLSVHLCGILHATG